MEDLKTKRRVVKGSITRIHGICLKEDVCTDDIKVRISKLEELFAQYEAIQGEIDMMTKTKDEQLVEDKYRNEIESKYFAVKSVYSSRIREEDVDHTVIENDTSQITEAIRAMASSQNSIGLLLERLTTEDRFQSTPVNNTSSAQLQQEPRLPRIQIPEFDGTYTDWIRFRDLFDALIHTRTTISAVEKFEYLQTRLKGEALSLIKHLKPTNDNYTIAWKLLNEKYDKSDNVKKAYLELLFDQPVMSKASADEMKHLHGNIGESINALKVLGEPVQHWNTILIFFLEKKLDSETHILWCREKRTEKMLDIELFLKFLEDRIYELDSIQSVIRQPSKNSISNRSRNQTSAYSSVIQSCICCNDSHFLYQCSSFKNLTVNDRFKLIRQHKLCFNCFRPNHLATNCKASSCKVCGLRHNSLLHFAAEESDNQMENIEQAVENQTPSQQSFTVNTLNQVSESITILPTMIVMVKDQYNQLQPCRALLDSGAQATLISETCLQRLQLRRMFDKTLMFGVGSNQSSYTRGKVNLEIVSDTFAKTIYTQAFCLSSLTRNLPSRDIDNLKLKYFEKLKMADPNFCKSSQIDIILGADIFGYCVLPDRIQHPSGSPIAFNTLFGWVIMGKIGSPEEKSIFAAHVSLDLNDSLQRFWEIEDLQTTEKILSKDEAAAEEHYKRNYEKMPNGNYMVRLPFNDSDGKLGESRTAALKRLMSMEKRFRSDPVLKDKYVEFIDEYRQLKHMSEDTETSDGYFMPHHAVLKPSSTTTKLRVVFDASCGTSNGRSLNDNLLVGPTIQNDLFTILLKFRMFNIGIAADVEKMYRQVTIHPEDRRYQRILWRDSENEEVKEYCLNTVTYGVASAPFLAIRTLHQIALDNVSCYPEVANAIDEQFYVDDFMACCSNVQSALLLKDQLCKVLGEAGFHLRKWSSNSKQFLQSVDLADRASSTETVIDSAATVKTLGLLWNTESDCFRYSIDLPPVSEIVTKRTVLSDISRIFDPIGMIAPIVISMKIFMQKLWLHGFEWDQQLPENLCHQWRTFRDNINFIDKFEIQRWLKFEDGINIELHGFSDASELAYAAVVYLKVTYDDGKVYTALISSKTRVAPVKQISLPRLELCGAHLLVKLMVKVQRALGIEKSGLFGWTDSTIVLAWLSDHPSRWKSFIGNRTSHIIQNIPASQWNHIPSRDNPADLATRGITPADLIDNELWWHGPREFLYKQRQHDVIIPDVNITTDIDMEERKKVILHNVSEQPYNIFDLYSKYHKLLRITALILRFIYNCKHGKQERKISLLTTLELKNAEYQLVKAAQHQSFAHEIHTLTKCIPLPRKHKLTGLAPFMDEKGLLRVGGRIDNARITYDQKHPMILHKDHRLTELLVTHYHWKYLHSGQRHTQYLIGLKYWIPGVTILVKRCIYKCVTCMRFRAIPFTQQTGKLPHCRLQQTSAFINTGVDFAGPIQIKSWKGRGSKLYKAWIAIFICLTTKAIHLELVTELSTDAFTASLRRFVSRRGKPLHIFSDNGTNFVGCNQQLCEMYQYLQQERTQNDLQNELCNQQIQWHFSPPFAPHFGGMWEAGVKSTKYHLKRILADSSVTFEELYTVLCQVECCLNSRPLCIKFEGDVDPLTPAHFLIFRSMATVPDEQLNDVKFSHCNRWQYLQKLVQSFWKKWSLQYLSEMQHRPKWATKLKNLKVDDIVIVKDDKLPPAQWSIARIMQTHPGADGLVRVVTVKTSRGVYKRPITKLCPLFLDI